MKMDGLLFPTSEHAYQWHACMEHLNTELAEKVMNAKSPRDAKQIAAQLKGDVSLCDWGRIRYEVMKRVLIAKADSSKQFRDELIRSGNRLLVESSPNDLYCGSGLNYHLTQTTHPDYYPGLNKLGKLLCEVRVLLRENISTSSLPAEAMDEVTTPLPATPTSGNIDTKTDNMNDDVTPHIPLSDDVTSRPSRNVSIRSRTSAVKSSHFRSPSPSPTRLKSVKSMRFKAQNPTLKNFIRSHVKLYRSASPIRDHPEPTCQVVQTTGDSDSVDNR